MDAEQLTEGSRWLAASVIRGAGDWSTMISFTLITVGVSERHVGTIGSYFTVSRALMKAFTFIPGVVIREDATYIPVDMKEAS